MKAADLSVSNQISYRAAILLSDRKQTGRYQTGYPQAACVVGHYGK